MDLTVTLEPHVGQMNDAEVGEINVTHDQWMIMVSSEAMKKASGRDKMHVGYVGVLPGRPINFLPTINRFGPGVADAVAERVKQAILDAATEAAKQADGNSGKVAKENLERETSTNRKHFSPPGEKVMTAAPPNVQSASVDDDDVEALS